MVMCTQSNQARKRYTISAALFSWLILAGYLVLPNTFTSLQSSKTLSGSKGGQLLQSTIRNVKLLPFAGVLCLIGVAGISRLWYKWRRNYVWLITYIFMYVKFEVPRQILTAAVLNRKHVSRRLESKQRRIWIGPQSIATSDCRLQNVKECCMNRYARFKIVTRTNQTLLLQV